MFSGAIRSRKCSTPSPHYCSICLKKATKKKSENLAALWRTETTFEAALSLCDHSQLTWSDVPHCRSDFKAALNLEPLVLCL